MDDLFQFREVHVVSDLHLGGIPGFQIFGQGQRFKNFVDQLQKSAAGPAALVINGDMVDFLAEPGATYFDSASALGKLQRIVSEPAFSPVFEALRDWVSASGRLLAITLGNHDLELALPVVREWLLRDLSGGDPAARGRILFSFEGAGFRCRVGRASVLCLHGNEVDAWNVTDFEKLRRMCLDSWAGRDGVRQSWIPSAGTKLVIEVMNPLKQSYRWIDLLKPENDAVPDVLLAVDTGQVRVEHFLDGLESFMHRTVDSVKMAIGWLGAEDEVQQSRSIAQPALLARAAAAAIGPSHPATQDLLWEAERRFINQEDPFLTAAGDQQGNYLGITSLARQTWRRFRGDSPEEALRQGLRDLHKDRSFEWTERDATARDMDHFVGPEIDYLVTGHTHLRRALKRTRGPGWYYNSGTWANLMRLNPDQLSEAAKFQAIFPMFGAGAGNALEGAKLILGYPTVVSIFEDGSQTHSELREVQDNGSSTPIAGTRFSKV
jgi:UDP-2,3-diacylglucosamine pyrophosphatase LpxH